MKRIIPITLISLAMFAVLAVNGSRLLARAATPAAAAAAAAMQTANELYESGRFVQATHAYEQLVDQGYTDSALFYNLGNAYYKQGDPGRAIVNYRRAQQLAPRDPDIQANLTLARSQTADRASVADDGNLLSQFGQAMQSWFMLDELALVAAGMWVLFVFVIILTGTARQGSHWHKGLKTVLVAVSVALAVSVLALGSYLYAGSGKSAGVIVADVVDVTSGPGAQYMATFSLHSGAEVSLVETRGSWVRLVLPGGELEGWVPGSAVEAVVD
jgi:cytochrome c-type biogenesis protein CcmH/NrfG